MTSKREKMNDRIDKLAKSAKRTSEKVADASEHAADVMSKRAHDVGQGLKDAGEKIMKKADRR